MSSFSSLGRHSGETHDEMLIVTYDKKRDEMLEEMLEEKLDHREICKI